MRAWSLAIVLAGISGCHRNPVTRAECDSLLDRYTEAVVRSADSKATGGEVERARAEARDGASKSKPFAACTQEVTREQMDCALAAWGQDAIERCLVPIW